MAEALTASFGVRFIAEVRRGLGSTVHWGFATLQALDTDDRAVVVRVLRESDPYLSYALAQAILTQEPETAAAAFVANERSKDLSFPPYPLT